MAIEIKVDAEASAKENEGPTLLEMNARRSLDGNIMIFDHIDIDIVYAPVQKKVVTFANKCRVSRYAAQNRMFDYLMRHSVVIPESIRGGNVMAQWKPRYQNLLRLRRHQGYHDVHRKILEEEKPRYVREGIQRRETENLGEPDAEAPQSLAKFTGSQERLHRSVERIWSV